MRRPVIGRGEELVKSGFVTKDAYDQRASSMHQVEAQLVLDRAAIDAAKLNLGYTEIRAPFAGRLGRNQAAKGALVGPASGALNTLIELDPIYVAFNPSESDLVEIATARAAGKIDAEISLAGTDTIRKGTLTFLDNTVDKATGTIAARVTIANPDFVLLPGQYVRVRLHIRDEPDAFMAPQAALGSNQMGKFVYVVGAGDKAEQRLLTLGPMDGELVSVTKGLSEGERIIVGNLQKIGPGSPVKPLPQEAESQIPSRPRRSSSREAGGRRGDPGVAQGAYVPLDCFAALAMTITFASNAFPWGSSPFNRLRLRSTAVRACAARRPFPRGSKARSHPRRSRRCRARPAP